jgi:di/tricarboxylate transporter
VSIHLIGVLALAVVFVLGTVRPVNLGALALVAAFLIGSLVAHEKIPDILKGFPADLFVLLVGVTYLFGLAAANGTIQTVIDRVVRVVGDRPAFIPWLIFVFSAIPTTAGALGPASVAMLAPLSYELGDRYRLDSRMVALMVMHGVGFGNFSPLGGLAIIVREVAAKNGLVVSPIELFLGNAAYNLALAVAIFLVFGGMRKKALAANPEAAAPPAALGPKQPFRVDQVLTLLAIVGVGVGALVYNLNIGFLALIAACALHLAFPRRAEGAEKRIVWSVVLLICGVVTLVAGLQRYGTIDLVGTSIAGLGAPLLTAFLLCLVAAVTSAFASSSGLLGVLIPLAVPFLALGQVGATGMIVALAISATVVDATPFSSVGALIVASCTPEDRRQRVFRTMLYWGIVMAVTAPILTWLVFILPSVR